MALAAKLATACAYLLAGAVILFMAEVTGLFIWGLISP